MRTWLRGLCAGVAMGAALMTNAALSPSKPVR